MSKIYFAEYIPVEGEIKQGDYYIDNSLRKNTLTICRATPSKDLLEDKNCWKVKLCLCSRDIQISDNVQYRIAGKEEECVVLSKTEFAAYTNLRLENKGIYFNAKQEDCIKVIGEISPDAIWVTRGMEFDEDDVCIMATDKHFDISNPIEVVKKEDIGEIWVEIKCPSCKTFH